MSAEDKSDRFEGVAPADIVERHLLDNMRVLHLAGDVDIESVTALTRKMLFLEDMDPHSDITLRINSYGGSAEATFGLVDVMQRLKCDVRTVAEGSAMLKVQSIKPHVFDGMFTLVNGVVIRRTPLSFISS